VVTISKTKINDQPHGVALFPPKSACLEMTDRHARVVRELFRSSSGEIEFSAWSFTRTCSLVLQPSKLRLCMSRYRAVTWLISQQVENEK